MGAVAITALFLAAIVFLVLLGQHTTEAFAKLSPEAKAKPLENVNARPVWPPTEIVISDKISDESHANFVFCDPRYIRSFFKEQTAFINDEVATATGNGAVVPSDSNSSVLMRRSQKWLVDHQTLYLQEEFATLVPAGKYKIIGFFDENGEPIKLDAPPKAADIWPEFVYEGHHLYGMMGTTDFWTAYRNGGGRQIPLEIVPASQHVLSKQEWKNVVPQNPGLVAFGRISCNREALFDAVGRPSQTQEAGDDEYLYWDCSDGQIQVTCARGQYELGMVGGSVNEN